MSSDPTQSFPSLVTRLRAGGSVYAEDEARLLLDHARTPTELADFVERRTAGLPLEQIVGSAEFCGLRLAVEPGVFVPRRRTEHLARTAMSFVRPNSVVLDLCCGCGAVAAALLDTFDDIEVHATEIDPVAAACARRNLSSRAQVYTCDLDQGLPTRLHGRIDVVTANAPYVPSDQIALLPHEARVHEPRAALDGGTDGLAVVDRVVACAQRWLAPNGHLLIETSDRQSTKVADLMTQSGLDTSIDSCEDLNATVVIGRRAT